MDLFEWNIQKKLQSNDHSVWCKLYNMYWNHFNTVWNTQRIVEKVLEYILNMMHVVCKKPIIMILKQHDYSLFIMTKWV